MAAITIAALIAFAIHRATPTARAFIEAGRAGEFDRALEHVHSETRPRPGRDDLEALFTHPILSAGGPVRFRRSGVSLERVHLDLVDARDPVASGGWRLELALEGLAWRITGLSPLDPQSLESLMPRKTRFDALARDAVHRLAQALDQDDLAGFHADWAAEARAEYPLEQVVAVYTPIADWRPSISERLEGAAVSMRRPAINARGAMIAEGQVGSPSRLDVIVAFLWEGFGWRIAGVQVAPPLDP